MNVVVVRSGGFAGIRVTWEVRVDDQPDRAEWFELVESLPWDDAPSAPPGEPDRYIYRITCEPHEVVLPERQLDGPWRTLVDRVRERARRSPQPEPGASPSPPSGPGRGPTATPDV
ncbi:protealysin inhibitor emfourin [Microbacterium paludicola]|uniref:protealysin inhibitor emfourin n=1 Tax=Microbacterium paludicola TaxID=300019 RepID=UPI001D168C13|nr:protealysin inhibitor emfourin [Microbacterium paludicola]